MEFCTLDKFVLQGLEDNCYMLVDKVEFVAMNIPIILRGEMFQIDDETGEAHSIGRKQMQVNIETDAFWPDEGDK
jgi:hypothetical protein